MPDPVLITTDVDRTLIFSPRATRQLGGGLPAEAVEIPGGQTAGELCRAARDAIAALPGHVLMCLATSRSLARLARLALPFGVHYAVAANGGVILVGGKPDLEWAGIIRRDLRGVAPARSVRALLARFAGLPWLERLDEPDELCCLALVDRAALPDGQFDEIAESCGELGWRASLIGRKLYAFPVGIGKERAAAFVAGRMEQETGVPPLRLAAGDTEHDLAMLEAADLAWVPAGSDLAASPAGRFKVTTLPGHCAAAQITREWLEASLR
ncbi:MAG TPA: hypothetical protein VLX31_11090 [Streptosporangiaceae bacterium]|nr:hypothetical protein [Streptosporangiaceae bacterium]